MGGRYNFLAGGYVVYRLESLYSSRVACCWGIGYIGTISNRSDNSGQYRHANTPRHKDGVGRGAKGSGLTPSPNVE